MALLLVPAFLEDKIFVQRLQRGTLRWLLKLAQYWLCLDHAGYSGCPIRLTFTGEFPNVTARCDPCFPNGILPVMD
jgi:hypothetical protein